MSLNESIDNSKSTNPDKNQTAKSNKNIDSEGKILEILESLQRGSLISSDNQINDLPQDNISKNANADKCPKINLPTFTMKNVIQACAKIGEDQQEKEKLPKEEESKQMQTLNRRMTLKISKNDLKADLKHVTPTTKSGKLSLWQQSYNLNEINANYIEENGSNNSKFIHTQRLMIDGIAIRSAEQTNRLHSQIVDARLYKKESVVESLQAQPISIEKELEDEEIDNEEVEKDSVHSNQPSSVEVQKRLLSSDDWSEEEMIVEQTFDSKDDASLVKKEIIESAQNSLGIGIERVSVFDVTKEFQIDEAERRIQSDFNVYAIKTVSTKKQQRNSYCRSSNAILAKSENQNKKLTKIQERNLSKVTNEQAMIKCIDRLDKAIHLNEQNTAVLDFAYYETPLGQMNPHLATYTPLWQILTSMPITQLNWNLTRRHVIMSIHTFVFLIFKGGADVSKFQSMIMCSSIVSGHKPLGHFKFQDIITCADINESGMIAIGFITGRMRLFDGKARSNSDCTIYRPKRVIDKHDGKINVIKFRKYTNDAQINDKYKAIISCGDDGILGQWVIKNSGLQFQELFSIDELLGKYRAKMTDVWSRPTSAVVIDTNSFDTSMFVIGTDGGHILFFSLQSFNEDIFVKRAHYGPVKQIKWCPLHKYVCMTGGHNFCVKVWDVKRKYMIKEIALQWTLVHFEWSPFVATRMFMASLHDAIYVFDMDCTDPINKFSTENVQRISTFALHKSTSIMAIGDRKGSICIYKLSENIGKPTLELEDEQNESQEEEQALFNESIRFEQLIAARTGIPTIVHPSAWITRTIISEEDNRT